jgi:hypothetical protein
MASSLADIRHADYHCTGKAAKPNNSESYRNGSSANGIASRRVGALVKSLRNAVRISMRARFRPMH